MDTLRVDTLVFRSRIQFFKYADTGKRSFVLADNFKVIAAITNLNAEPLFDLPDILIKLTAQVRESLIIDGLE